MMRQRGFTLIEVLVAILILALGVMAVAGLQLAALRMAQQSAFQTSALQLASEMADRMRANDGQMGSADASNLFLQVDFRASDGISDPPPSLCYAGACTPEELARADIHQWQQRLKAALPGARAVICRDASPWDAARDALNWGCAPAPSAPVVIKLGWNLKSIDSGAEKPTAKPALAISVMPYVK